MKLISVALNLAAFDDQFAEVGADFVRALGGIVKVAIFPASVAAADVDPVSGRGILQDNFTRSRREKQTATTRQ